MENVNVNGDDQKVVTTQEEQQVEQPDTGTQQEPVKQEEQPEFYLDKDGKLQWNTDEYDKKYPEQNSDDQHQEEEDDSDDDEEEEEQSKQGTEQNTEPNSGDDEPKFKVKVDGEEIEVTQEELLRGYMRQKDYTQKTQQLAEQRKQYESFRNQNQNQFQQQQDYRPQQQQQQNNSNEDLIEIAKKMAAQRLGLESVDDLSELDFNHISAVVEARRALENQQNQMLQRQKSVENLEAQLRSEEPKYDEIMKGLGETLQNLPVSRYNKLQEAYNQGNPEPLRELFKEMQKDYYAKAITKVEQKKKPHIPTVEKTANTPVVPKKKGKKIDLGAFGHMPTEQKAKILLDMGLLD